MSEIGFKRQGSIKAQHRDGGVWYHLDKDLECSGFVKNDTEALILDRQRPELYQTSARRGAATAMEGPSGGVSM